LYVLGKGVQKDYVKAYKWLSLSAAQERKDAAEFRDLISPQMTPSQIAEAQRLAREWKPKK
jgi:TPR repeat protein